jgi:hypothetical protein
MINKVQMKLKFFQRQFTQTFWVECGSDNDSNK